MRAFRLIFRFSTLLCAVSHAAPVPPVLSLIQATLLKTDASIKPDHYDIARADLDGDGKQEVLAITNGQSSHSDTGGSTLFVLKGAGKGFISLGSVKVVNAPIYLRKSVTNGCRDLVVTVRGGEAKPGLAALSFDGKTYPSAAGEGNTALNQDDQLIFSKPIPPFDQTAILQGITFKVVSPNLKTANTVTIAPGGLEIDNKPATIEIIGTVARIEAGDIDMDGSPEIYIYTRDGNGSSLLAFSVNKQKSLSQIFLPALKDDDQIAQGYRGHDEFAVVQNCLARRFPIFPVEPGDTKPTGKMRELQYKLQQGEAGWLLKVEKATEF
ncbi:MAG: hypothetical protein V4819_09050 [Verrucomicrobiota bacterium]